MDHASKRARSAPLESRSQSPDALATLPHVAAATPFLGPRCRGVVPCGSSQTMEPPGNPVRFNGLLPLRRRVASSLPACTRSRAQGVLVFGGVGLPRRCVCHDRGPVRIGGPCVSRGAQASGVRPLPPPATRRCRGGRAPLRGAVILDFPNGDKLTEFIKLYLVSYTLGMLARYHPSMWTALPKNAISCWKSSAR